MYSLKMTYKVDNNYFLLLNMDRILIHFKQMSGLALSKIDLRRSDIFATLTLSSGGLFYLKGHANLPHLIFQPLVNGINEKFNQYLQ